MEAGFKIGGMKVNNLRYVDDTTLIATSKTDLIELLTAVESESEKFNVI